MVAESEMKRAGSGKKDVKGAFGGSGLKKRIGDKPVDIGGAEGE